MARRLLPALLFAAITAGAVLPAAASAERLVTARIGAKPLSDRAAARRVRGSWEPRPQNDWANHRMPSRAELRAFRRQNTANPYAKWVTGHYTGTTDQIIQWAAAKWGLSVRLLRAVAATETWWVMSFVGNDGTSYGLFQVRTPYHCQGDVVCGIMRNDTAMNADYYGAIIRSYYDGRQTWLNTVSGNGRRYRAGDLWGSVGYWAAGRWHVAAGDTYNAEVKDYYRRQVWAQPNFVGK